MSSAFPQPSVSTARLWAAAFVLSVATLALYAPVGDFPFLSWDDPIYVSDNPNLREPFSLASVVHAFAEPYEANWIPLTWISLHLDAALFGLEPAVFHAENVLLHLAASLVLLFAFARATGALGASAFVAAVFALHPLHVESVAWIAQRKDCLSGLFFALAIAAHFSFARQPTAWRRAGVVAATAAALLAKPTMVTLPLVLLLLDFWPLGRLARGAVGEGRAVDELAIDLAALRRAALEKLPLFALAGVAGALTIAAQRSAGSIELLQIPFSWRAMNAFSNYVVYLGKAFWPSDLAYYYTWSLDEWLPWRGGLGTLVLALGTLGALALSRRHRAWIVGWLWYVVTLLPVVGFVQVGMQARADRYMYLPLIGLAIALGFGLPALLAKSLRRERALAALGLAAALSLAALTAVSSAQLQHWRSGLALYARALDVTEENFFAHNSYAGEILGTGGAPGEAIGHYEEALRLRPRWYRPHLDLARLLLREGEAARALEWLERAAAVRPAEPEAWLGQAEILVAQGSFEAAASRLARGLERVAPARRGSLQRAADALGGAVP